MLQRIVGALPHMLVLFLLDVLTIAVVVLLTATQVILPLLRGRPIFPIFRRSHRLERDLADATAELEEAELERAVEEKRRAAEALRDDD